LGTKDSTFPLLKTTEERRTIEAQVSGRPSPAAQTPWSNASPIHDLEKQLRSLPQTRDLGDDIPPPQAPPPLQAPGDIQAGPIHRGQRGPEYWSRAAVHAVFRHFRATEILECDDESRILPKLSGLYSLVNLDLGYFETISQIVGRGRYMIIGWPWTPSPLQVTPC
jgi:hypothetical protein